jgi:hypothetical protein
VNKRLITAAAILCGVSPELIAAPQSGQVAKTSPIATLYNGTAKRPLGAGDPVVSGDRITTGPAGNAQIIFQDATRLVIGPRSDLTIDAYVTGSGDRASKFAIGATKGFFRFLSGNSQKSAYAITTPSASLGIRGTEFDFTVRPTGRTLVLRYSGVVRLCGRGDEDRKGGCRELDKKCEIGGTTRDGDARLRNEPDLNLGVNELYNAFPYARSDVRLGTQFKVTVGTGCRGAVAQNRTNPSTGDHPARSPSPVGGGENPRGGENPQ